MLGFTKQLLRQATAGKAGRVLTKRSGCGGRSELSTLTERPRILVTGASGQIGQELVPYLRSAFGVGNVIASDVRTPPPALDEEPVVHIDVMNANDISKAVDENGVNTIVHLAAILSAAGERNPSLALKVNNEGTQNVLEVARTHKLKVFCPSTIAVYGPESPKYRTKEDCITRPTTMYGITKVHAELLGEYYHNNFGVDFRSLRYPGVISTKAMPGGGTTDYAVEIFHEAIKRGRYTCYLNHDAALPMIYMPDLLRATMLLLEADPETLTRRTYNVGAMSFTPAELGENIQRYLKGFVLDYQPDFRQAIAETWPADVDFSIAARDWGWAPSFDLDGMTRDIIGQFIHQDLYAATIAAEEEARSASSVAY